MSKSSTIETPLYLAIDQGGQSSRALVFDAHGQCQAQAHASISTQHPAADRVEHNPEEMIASVRQVIAEIYQQLGPSTRQLHSAGLACQRSSIVCWDTVTGKPLSPIISWQDRRMAQWLTDRRIDRDSLHQQTGLFPSPHYGASKLHWCLNSLPEVKQAAHQQRLCIGPMATWLTHQLVDEHPLFADPANASRTLLWDLDRQDWSPALLELFGINIDCLPHCCPSHHPYGTMQGLPLTLVTGDQSAALFGHGQPQLDTTYVNIGTGAFIQRPVEHRPLSPTLLTSVVHSDSAHTLYALEGTINSAAEALNWLARQHHTTPDNFMLERWLENISAPPLFINSITGLGSPYWRTDINAAFIGDTTGELDAQAVAVIESIVFLIKVNLEQMEQVLGHSNQVVVSGGLAQLSGLCQRLADLFGQPVLRFEQKEATARGLAFLLADRPNHWHNDDAAVVFNANANPEMIQRYHQWKTIMAQCCAVESE